MTDAIIRSAIISECKLYRYRLERDMGGAGKVAAAFLVNPSKADGLIDDQTVRKGYGFAHVLGWRKFIYENLFAFRATDINELKTAHEPIGPDNDRYIEQALRDADIHVVGWGALAKLPETLRGRWKDIVRIADRVGCPLYCIGVNADGHPKHPQMTAYNVPMTPWNVPWFANRAPSTLSGDKRNG